MGYFGNRSVLVAGGAGFIGSYLVELLLADGARVSIADDFSRGRMENLMPVIDDIRVDKVDLRDPSAARQACKGHEVVMNLAAPVAGVEFSRTHHGLMLTETVLLAANVLEAARQAGVERYLYCSSSCVYPDDALVPTPEYDADRDGPEEANAGYGWGKRIGEQQARYYEQEYGIEIAIGRPFNSFGPREYPERIEQAHVIPAITSRLLSGENPLVVWGSGNQTRSFIHARDTALGLKALTEHGIGAGPVNVGHDEETSMRELVELLLDLTGEERRVVFDTTKPEGARRKSAEVTRLRELTGFMPSTPLREGLEEMLVFLEKLASATPEGIARAL